MQFQKLISESRTDMYWVSLAIHTRRYGQCYIHAAMRFCWHESDCRKIVYGGEEFFVCHRFYGRSKNKFKVYANYNGKHNAGKPVPTKLLKDIYNAMNKEVA